MSDLAIDHLAEDRAAQMQDILKKELLSIPSNGTEIKMTVRGDGKGKLRYQLKRLGLIGMGHADGKGRALVWKTPLGKRVSAVVEKETR